MRCAQEMYLRAQQILASFRTPAFVLFLSSWPDINLVTETEFITNELITTQLMTLM
jgi:hypothetical protein